MSELASVPEGGKPEAAASVPEKGRIGAAFFDLDKTLIEGSSGVHFARAAYRAGLATRRQIAGDVWANLQFRLHGSTDEKADELRKRIFDAIAGVPVIELKRLVPSALAGILPRVYEPVLRTAFAHQDAGRPTFIVTAASQETADVLAYVLTLDGGIGSRSEIRDGIYTGRPAGPFTYRDGKAEAIRQVAQREGIDLAQSYAYSDSESDLPMLRAVGHPVAVNPDRDLERIARAEGWQIMRFDWLARRLRIASTVGAVGLVGGGGGYVVARHRSRSRLERARAASRRRRSRLGVPF